MIKAIFFDWFNTLAYYYPPREGLHALACSELGISVDAGKLTRSLVQADQFWFGEEARYPIKMRSPQEQKEFCIQYERLVLQGAEIVIDDEPAWQANQRVWKLVENAGFTLYDDVLPTLNELKRRGLTLGLISNLRKDMLAICRELKLEPLIDFVVTSAEVGADKPQPAIFQAALQRAKVAPSEAIHVGDQYNSDVIGAQQVGIKPILIDRYHIFDETVDCPKINRLDELWHYLMGQEQQFKDFKT
jgi:putative hydrolase of the HAD superfamily